MKKTAIAMMFVMTALMAGCGSAEKVITGDVANAGGKQSVESTAGAQSQAQTDSAQNGYVFEANGVTIQVDGEAADYLTGLGEPLSYYEAPSCAFGDLDKIYTFSGFEVDTYSLEGVDYVSVVILKDDSVSTPEGLCIGDPVSKIEEVYGQATSKEDTMIAYKKDEMKLCFLIRDDAVVSIEYRSLVLE